MAKTTFYVTGIDMAGMTISQSLYGELADATTLLNAWRQRGQEGSGWDKPLVMAVIADTVGIRVRYVFNVPGVPAAVDPCPACGGALNSLAPMHPNAKACSACEYVDTVGRRR